MGFAPRHLTNILSPNFTEEGKEVVPLGEGDLSISQFLVAVAARGVLVRGTFEERSDADDVESAFMGKDASDLNSAQSKSSNSESTRPRRPCWPVCATSVFWR